MPPRANIQMRAVLLISVGHFTVDFYSGFVAPLVPVLQQKIGFSLTKAAFLISLFSLSSSLVQTGFGFLFDRVSKAHLVALGPLLAGVTISCIGLTSSYFVLSLVIFAGGLSVAAFHPQGAALAGLKSGHRHSLGMSIFVTGGTAGIATGTLAASFLVDIAGLPATAYAMLPGIGVAVVIWRFLDYRNPEGFQAPLVMPAPGRRYGLLFGLGGLATLRALVILGCYAFIPLYLTGLGTSISTVGWTLFLFGFSGGLGGLTASQWAERIGNRNVVYASFLVPFPFLCGYLLLGTSLPGLACLGAAGYAISAAVPVIISIGQRSFPKRMGTVSSVVMGLSWGTAGLLITPAGAIAERVGIYAVLWGFTWVLILGFVVALLFFRQKFVGSAGLVSGEPLEAGEL